MSRFEYPISSKEFPIFNFGMTNFTRFPFRTWLLAIPCWLLDTQVVPTLRTFQMTSVYFAMFFRSGYFSANSSGTRTLSPPVNALS